tara:strand:- start:558 stop:695 length:138 start_codon:yes stop_codon:yes gene_type:complete
VTVTVDWRHRVGTADDGQQEEKGGESIEHEASTGRIEPDICANAS